VEISVEDLRNGSHKAFEELFTRYYEALCRYAYSLLKDTVEAEELVQKVFYKLWDQKENIFIQTSISSYLYRMVHNGAINQSQLKRKTNTVSINYINFTDIEKGDESESIALEDLNNAFEKALKELPEQSRVIFELSRKRHLQNSEISEQLKISVKTVEAHITKSLRHLKVELKDFFVFAILFQLFK
jgi:RNA polymerase sigma-70 factor, ECF subfamily